MQKHVVVFKAKGTSTDFNSYGGAIGLCGTVLNYAKGRPSDTLQLSVSSDSTKYAFPINKMPKELISTYIMIDGDRQHVLRGLYNWLVDGSCEARYI